MITIDQLQKYIDSYLLFDKKLDAGKIDPIMTNGLMVMGKEVINKVGFGVSASLALFNAAEKEGCDAIIVHHSFNFPSVNRFDKIFQNLIGFLIENEISLFGYHFLLDAHPQIGNNVQILKTIGAKPSEPFYHSGQPWGWVGEFANGKELKEIKNKLLPLLSKRTIVYDFGPKMVKRVAAVSGKGAPYPSEMQGLIDQKIDLYITGEAHEWNRELFKEAGIHFIAGGHYATEIFGIKALMKKVKEKFPQVETEWLEVYNEV